MTRYDLMKEIVGQVEAFEKDQKTGEDLNFNDFAQWLAIKTRPVPLFEPLNQQQEPIVFDGGVLSTETDELGTLVSLLYRYVKIYAKRAMENSPLSNVDDFSYLIIPMAHGAMSKTELIAHNAHEKTTGMEIIKRLTKLGFLVQTDDPSDGRSQLVHISETGRSALFPLLTEMRKVSVIANGNLSEIELTTLIHLLRKLDVFHKGILNHEKTVDLNGILAKYF
jgi:MarR family transcriptional regulator, lower aerobic nicotinate degradation pathway regulator